MCRVPCSQCLLRSQPLSQYMPGRSLMSGWYIRYYNELNYRSLTNGNEDTLSAQPPCVSLFIIVGLLVNTQLSI
ncbi:hypothetical protein B0T26DRAFT_702666, partial [Lasiosphaeria miniovina]